MIRISALIVVYNEKIDTIACLSSLISAPPVVQVVICDNSTMVLGNEKLAEQYGFIYCSMGGNVGLPRAYNHGISLCDGDVVCLFDDDSEIREGYFGELERRYSENPDWDILLPRVDASGIRLSPCVFNGHRPIAFTGDVKPAENLAFTGINSGMAVKRHVFDVVRYDERLFLDLVDHRFCLDARACGYTIEYCPTMRLSQSYSLDTDSANQALRRLKIFEKDARVFYSESLSGRLYCLAMLFYRRLKLSRKYRTLSFLFGFSIMEED